ncbi:MAG: methyltransferase domain-containing protein, partial [Planctomycetales bacterium]|nr:methyltransferase domain-containing protein [Planctomycetales bacterium]
PHSSLAPPLMSTNQESTAQSSEHFRWLLRFGRELLLRPEAELPHDLQPWQRTCLQQQRELRWRSRHRFDCPEQWLWTPKSLAQASDTWCAAYKASLFPIATRVVDACCGAGSDLLALARRGETSGIDLDPRMAALAQDNARAQGYAVPVQRLRLPEQWSPQPDCWLHIDPDRRPQGTRTRDADSFSPSLEQILEMARSTVGAMIKLAPSTRMADDLAQRITGETQRVWLGNQGECRQQLLLTGQLMSLLAGQRQAVLCEPPARDTQSTPAVPTVSPGTVLRYAAQPIAEFSWVTKPRRYIYDLHNVLHASELHQSWAAEQGMQPLGGEHGYFTSDAQCLSPWAQRFEVLETLAWDDRRVRKWLRSHGAGPVEVKCRLLKLDANAFQRRYSTAEGSPLTLLVTRLGERVRAIVARR